MSYANGVNGAQQFLGTEAVVSSNVSKTAESVAGSAVERARTISGGAVPVDGTSLSATAATIAQSAADSDVRMEKVAGLQQAIAAGTYSVPAGDVAAKLIGALLR